MSVAEIEEKIIKPLSRAEKWQLIEDITQMLRQEEEAEAELSKYFKPGQKVGFWSPFDAFDMAQKMQNLLEQETV